MSWECVEISFLEISTFAKYEGREFWSRKWNQASSFWTGHSDFSGSSWCADGKSSHFGENASSWHTVNQSEEHTCTLLYKHTLPCQDCQQQSVLIFQWPGNQHKKQKIFNTDLNDTSFILPSEYCEKERKKKGGGEGWGRQQEGEGGREVMIRMLVESWHFGKQSKWSKCY